MIPYSRVLILNIIMDIVYTFICIICEVELEMNDGVYIIVLNGIPRGFSAEWQMIFVGIWQFGISITCIVSPVEFIFRYLRVVKNYTITYTWLTACALVVVLISINNATLLCLGIKSVSDQNATFGHLMSLYGWTATEEPCFTEPAWSLAKGKSIMSEKVRYMQAQLNRLMFAEVASLVSVFVIPIATAMVFLILRVQWIGFGVLVAIFIEWVPAVNPVTTIFLVGPYRRQLFGQLKKRVFDASTLHASVGFQPCIPSPMPPPQ